MYNNNINTFMQSILESQRRFFEAAAEQRDQLSQAMSSVVHNQLDASIERLQRFHDLVSNDTSGMKSDVLAATLKSAIDHHHHIKDRFATHTHHANTHKRTLRRLAMGAMAAFGVMSGVKAADAFESGSGSGNTSSSMVQDSMSSSDADSSSSESIKPYKGIIKSTTPDTATPKIKRSVQFTLPVTDPEPVTDPNKLNKKFFQKLKLADSLSSHKEQVNKKIAADVYLELAQSEGTTPQQISEIANKLELLGSDYSQTTLKVIELMIDPSKNPTPKDIIDAANMCNRMNIEGKALELYIQAAKDPNITYEQIAEIMSNLKLNNPIYANSFSELYDLAGKVYEQKANDPKATHLDIFDVADRFKKLGDKYFDKAAATFEKGIITLENDFRVSDQEFQLTDEDIQFYAGRLSLYYSWAADGLKELGDHNSKRVKEINQLKDALDLAQEGDAISAANKIRRVANAYPQGSAPYNKYMTLADKFSKG